MNSIFDRGKVMRFMASGDTDIGICRRTNQDSVLIKHADTKFGEILFAAVCDGMGGLTKGEVASAAVVWDFSEWLDRELPGELPNVDFGIIGSKWELKLKELNARIRDYGKRMGVSMGTTFTGVLMFGEQYLLAHVGDTRLYHISKENRLLTEDQTVSARAVRRGEITIEEAREDRRQHTLLQCIGASQRVEPQILSGRIDKGIYVLCSDGFRHKISREEMRSSLDPEYLSDKWVMHKHARYLIDLVKNREEKDNISVVLIKAE